MLIKAVPFECKVDMDSRTISGYAAIFGNIDEGWDRISKGAFRKSISERFKKSKPSKVKLLWQHYMPLGMPTKLFEDSMGLGFEAKVSETPFGDECLTYMDDGVVSQMSFGYDVIKKEYIQEDDGREIRNLKELKLYEISPVTFPMNEETAITAVQKMVAGAPINDEAKSLLILAARMGIKTLGHTEEGDDESTELNEELIITLESKVGLLIEELKAVKALVQPTDPKGLDTDKPLKVDGSLLNPFDELKKLFRKEQENG